MRKFSFLVAMLALLLSNVATYAKSTSECGWTDPNKYDVGTNAKAIVVIIVCLVGMFLLAFKGSSRTQKNDMPRV